MLELKLLLVLVAANGMPVLARKWLREHWNTPVDFGLRLRDGRPLFGASKTWRGLALGTAAGFALGVMLRLPPLAALIIAACALLGDLLSSFIKRRLDRAPSASVPLLDQVPESLLPLLAGMALLDYSWVTAITVCTVFVVLHVGVSPLLYRAGIRRQPH